MGFFGANFGGELRKFARGFDVALVGAEFVRADEDEAGVNWGCGGEI